MTPTQLDHLRLIDAHLKRLLDIASKRTPGEWDASDNVCTADAVEGGYFITCDSMKTNVSTDANNATYIASCAGNAEAGWKATRAAIACLLVICDPASGADFTNYGGETFLPQILAAFPLETLNPKSHEPLVIRKRHHPQRHGV